MPFLNVLNHGRRDGNYNQIDGRRTAVKFRINELDKNLEEIKKLEAWPHWRPRPVQEERD
ncbi:hypothetical protein LAZ67_5003132 [Cordylochernes scorpioides]|uniref:Uncharacterized protein n=1 Tax=Cordylochernes scorpioides TaxID=51811 RepID=A0ABY6KH26_9ARAC|nr:hypothetical protein LAZ67_5003132 [Cordylochernes scorpioides]